MSPCCVNFVFCFKTPYCSILKEEAKCSFETSGRTYRTTECPTRQRHSMDIYRRQNLEARI